MAINGVYFILQHLSLLLKKISIQPGHESLSLKSKEIYTCMLIFESSEKLVFKNKCTYVHFLLQPLQRYYFVYTFT